MPGADFPSWFSASIFGGIGCAVLSALAIGGWSFLRRRGVSRQVTLALLLCLVASALDTLMEIWAQERLGVYGPELGAPEVASALAVSALAGWAAPLSAMVWFVLFASKQTATPTRAANRSAISTDDPGRQRMARTDGGAWGYLVSPETEQDTPMIYLTNEVILIGRDPGADLILADELVSRFHAALRWENSGASVTDLGSLNGTRINRMAISAKTPTRDGDTLQFGDRTFRFLLAPELTLAAPNATSTELSALEIETRKTAGVSGIYGSNASPLSLAWGEGTEDHREWTLRAALTTLGREATCGVVIPDDSVSRLHAQITRQPEGYFIVDVESSNGVYLNGEPVTSPRRINDGDLLRLGDAILAVRSVAPATLSVATSTPQETTSKVSAITNNSGRKANATQPRTLPMLPTIDNAER